MFLNRQRATKLGQETVRIIEAGRYTTEKGTVVEIGDLVRRAVSGTCSYPPNHPLPDPQIGSTLRDGGRGYPKEAVTQGSQRE